VTRIGTGVLLGNPEVGSAEWHDMRRPMVNGSEIAAVLGISPYDSPFSLWHRKAGNLGDVPETDEMYWGKQLEGVIRDEFNRRNGRAFRPMGQFRHRDREWQGGAPDGVDNGEILEAKTDRYGDRWGEEGTDELPAHYRAQILWYLDVLGLDVCHVAVLIAGSEYREYLVRYNADEAAFMREAAVKFLATITVGQIPALDGSEATYDAVQELHPEIEPHTVELDGPTARDYLRSLAGYEQATTEKRRCSARVIEAMGSARHVTYLDELIASRCAPKSEGKHPYLRAVNGASQLFREEIAS
jgi:putative phage-type endonuclease